MGGHNPIACRNTHNRYLQKQKSWPFGVIPKDMHNAIKHYKQSFIGHCRPDAGY